MSSRVVQATTAGESTLARNCQAEGQTRKLKSEKEILGQAPGRVYRDRKEPARRRADGRRRANWRQWVMAARVKDKE